MVAIVGQIALGHQSRNFLGRQPVPGPDSTVAGHDAQQIIQQLFPAGRPLPADQVIDHRLQNRFRRRLLQEGGIAGLIEDIHARGLDRNILVVGMGEFGRTPRVNHNNGCSGRDHWPDAMCALLSGGGLATGQVVGSTNAKGEYPKDRPLTPKDLLATIYHHLGIDYRWEFKDFSGRPIPVLGEGQPNPELM